LENAGHTLDEWLLRSSDNKVDLVDSNEIINVSSMNCLKVAGLIAKRLQGVRIIKVGRSYVVVRGELGQSGKVCDANVDILDLVQTRAGSSIA
jgi:hypothetical protein